MSDQNDPSPRADTPDRAGARPPKGPLELDAVFEALSHSRRRYLLYALLEEDEWTLDRLATKIAAWENGERAEDIPADDVPEAEIDRVYTSLYHAHVPKLADHEIIEFDRLTETITRGTNAEQALAALEYVGTGLDTDQETHARSRYDD